MGNCFKMSAEDSSGNRRDLVRLDFRISGQVEGVFFCKQAESLGLRGWVRNAEDGSVEGQLEGDAKKIKEMKRWLKEIGSPIRVHQSCIHITVSCSHITVFSEKSIAKFSFPDKCEIRR